MDFILAALQLTPAIVEAGEDIAAFVEWALGVYESGSAPTPADWDRLNLKEAELRARLEPARAS